MDLTLEQYRLGLNSNTVTVTAPGSGTAGTKDVDLYRGIDVTILALLVRGTFSAYGADWKTQYEVPQCFVSSTQEVVFQKGAPAGLMFEFTAIEDPNAATEADRFGKLKVQNATAL